MSELFETLHTLLNRFLDGQTVEPSDEAIAALREAIRKLDAGYVVLVDGKEHVYKGIHLIAGQVLENEFTSDVWNGPRCVVTEVSRGPELPKLGEAKARQQPRR